MSDEEVGGLGARLARWWRSRPPGPGSEPVHVRDPRFDDWEVVRDFGDVKSARAWVQHLRSTGIECAMTADWELDRFGRGEVSICVPPGSWSDAEAFLDNLDDPL